MLFNYNTFDEKNYTYNLVISSELYYFNIAVKWKWQTSSCIVVLDFSVMMWDILGNFW